uniref:hypothetical protein n=1 Tax=Tahibacter caeni TaxID=1453545 RepID=UPI0021487A79
QRGGAPATAPPVTTAAPSTPVQARRSASGSGPARLQWSASNDGRLYGYIVYRAEDRAGPYRRISSRVIHVLRDQEQVHSYTFEDTDVSAGKTYYYYVDTIDLRGKRERFMPVVEKAVR